MNLENKSVVFTLILFALLSALIVKAEANEPKKEQAKRELLSYLRKYSPEQYVIVSEVLNRPEKSRFELKKGCGNMSYTITHNDNMYRYIRSYPLLKEPRQMGTIVHEFCHSYQGFMGYKTLNDLGKLARTNEFQRRVDAYYFGEKPVLVFQDINFKTERVAESMPQKFRTFRFETYVTQDHIGSNEQGIYGLVDEWHAYYHGFCANKNFLKYLLDKKESDPKVWKKSLQLSGTILAYFEFKYFITNYLIYAQEHKKSVYMSIIINNNLRYCINKLDKSWQEAIEDYKSLLEESAIHLSGQGVKMVVEEDMDIWLDNLCMKSFWNEIRLLEEETKRLSKLLNHNFY